MEEEIVGEDRGTSRRRYRMAASQTGSARCSRAQSVCENRPTDSKNSTSAGDSIAGRAAGVLTSRGASGGGHQAMVEQVGPHLWRLESAQQELGRRRARAQPQKAGRSEADAGFARWGLVAE